MADLVDILSRDGARVIGFDIGFLEPSQSGGLQLLHQLQQQLHTLAIDSEELADFIAAAQERVDNDKRFANAIRNSSAAIILGYFFHMSEQALGHTLGQGDIDKQLAQINPSKYPLVMYQESTLDALPFLQAYAPENNIAILSDAAEAVGYFTLAGDRDGTIRWMPMMIQAGEDIYPPPAGDVRLAFSEQAATRGSGGAQWRGRHRIGATVYTD